VPIPKYFFAGADLKGVFESLAKNDPSVHVDIRSGMSDSYCVMERLEYSTKPSIAAVDGAAMGGGCELAIACDISIASETAVFGLPEVTLGLIAAAGGTSRLPKRIGKQRAMDLILTGRHVPAQEAYQMGLIARVVPKQSLQEEVEKTAKMIAANAPLAVQASKAVVAYEESILERGLGGFRLTCPMQNVLNPRICLKGSPHFWRDGSRTSKVIKYFELG
jgi:enoyl-CoA hydratase/carnithine racemase